MKLRKKIAIIFMVLVVVAVVISYFMNQRQGKADSYIIHGEELLEEPNAVPNDWMAMQRAYPHGDIKVSSYREGMHQAKDLHNKSPEMRNEWELLGPTNIGGRITDIAVHPSEPFTWYIGGATGGIFKTTDGGEIWENIFTDAATISIGDIAIDPNDKNIIYAGTGEANSSSFSFYGDGIYKSYDAGETWEHIGLEESVYVGRIIVDYNNSERVYLASCGTLFSPNEHRGVYRSENGGGSWEKILYLTDSTSAIDLVQHPEDPDILYAAMWERMRGRSYRRSFGESSGIYKSIDGGDTWDELTTGLPVDEDAGRIGIDICISEPDVLYAFYEMPDYGDVRVYTSEDGGESWERTNDGYLYQMNSTFGWYFGQIRVDPSNKNRVYVLGQVSYRTENGGTSWNQMRGEAFHVDHHALYIDDATGMMIEGNDGGLNISFNNGTTWSKINNLPLTQFYDIEIDYQNPYRIYGGTQDNNSIRTYSGEIDDWHALLGGDGFYSVVDYFNNDNIYCEYQWGNLYKSTNGGGSFYYIAGPMSNDRTNWSSPLVIDPQDPSVLYFGTYRVWKTTNWGNSWESVSSDLTDGDDGSTFHTVSTIAVSPVNTDIVIAGTDDGNVHISADGGDFWSDITEDLPKRWITRVAADPFDANTIYCTVSGFRWDEPEPHVFKSINLGESWVSITGNLPEIPMNVIVLDPEIPDRIIVGSDAGMFLTEDGGQYWVSISKGLANVPVVALKIHNPTRILVAGTYGLSAYKINLDDLTVGIDDSPTSSTELNKLKVHPNPVNFSVGNFVSINVELNQTGNIKIHILDVNGRLITTLVDERLDAGGHTYQWNGTSESGTDITPGVYFCKMVIDSEVVTKKIIVN